MDAPSSALPAACRPAATSVAPQIAKTPAHQAKSASATVDPRRGEELMNAGGGVVVQGARGVGAAAGLDGGTELREVCGDAPRGGGDVLPGGRAHSTAPVSR